MVDQTGLNATSVQTLPVAAGDYGSDVVVAHLVLVAPLGEPGGPVNEQHLALALRRLRRAEDEEARRNRRGVEEVRGKSDYRIE